MKVIPIFVLLGSLLNCGGEKVSKDCTKGACSEEAVVKDLTGLDGCGLLFELNDGTRLVPTHRVYIQAPKEEEDPLYYYQLVAGERVRISYDIESESMNACMGGKIVFITCITSCSKNVIEQ